MKPSRQIITEIARERGLEYEDLIGPSKEISKVSARWKAIIAVHKAYPKFSLRKMGSIFGGRTHVTIYHVYKARGIIGCKR